MSFLHMEIDPAGKITSHSFSPDVTVDRENLVSSDDILSGSSLQDNIFVSLDSNDSFNFIALPSYFPNEVFYVIHTMGGRGYGYLLTSSSYVHLFPSSQSIRRPFNFS